MPEFRYSGVPEFWCSGIPEFRNSETIFEMTSPNEGVKEIITTIGFSPLQPLKVQTIFLLPLLLLLLFLLPLLLHLWLLLFILSVTKI